MTRLFGSRPAVTLVELLIVLVVLGVTAGVVGLTLQTARPIRTVDPVRAAIAAARDSAIRTGHPVIVTVAGGAAILPVTTYPDGRVTVDPSMRIDPLTGALNATR